ncbi:hypothetical protein G419_21944 [Rhodococcus triatomae BKS 15-14]|nr:hypothetical protein G419_21944 [Rhodococcus triatomae BKS 15-14]
MAGPVSAGADTLGVVLSGSVVGCSVLFAPVRTDEAVGRSAPVFPPLSVDVGSGGRNGSCTGSGSRRACARPTS